MTLIPVETEARGHARDVLRFIARCEDPDAPLTVDLADPSTIDAMRPEIEAVLMVARERLRETRAQVRWLEWLIMWGRVAGEPER